MNHRALQRALVIAQYDPEVRFEALAEEVPAGAAAALGAAELAELARLDRRGLRTDPLRRRRLLRTLAEEYKASTTLLLAETRSLGGVETFFVGPAFRAAVLGDSPLAVAFGAFLAEAARHATTPQLRGVVALEWTRAASRRSARTACRPDVSLAPGVAVLAVDASVLPAVQAVERYLFEVGLMPQVALCDDAPRLPPLGALTGQDEHYLFQPAGDEVALSPIDADLYRVLSSFTTPAPRPEAQARVSASGIPAARAAEVLDGLLLEGLLSEGPPASAPRLARTGGQDGGR